MSELIFLTKIISWSGFVIGGFFVSVILSAGYFIACQSLNRDIKILSCILPAVIKFSVICIVVGFLLQHCIRGYIFDVITKSIEPADVKIYVNDRVMDEKFNEILEKSIRDRFQFKNKGSHPTEYFVVSLSSQAEEVHFTLGKDSKDPELYWLSIPDSGFLGEITFIRLNIDFHE